MTCAASGAAASAPQPPCSVSTATTVNQALALVYAEVFDAALLDMNLNGSKSDPVADALAGRGVPFAFSTGYSDPGSRSSCGKRPVLTKPYQYEDVVEMLSRLLPRADLEGDQGCTPARQCANNAAQ